MRKTIKSNLIHVASKADYKLTIKDKYNIFLNLPDTAIAVVFAYESYSEYSKLKSDIKYVRYSDDEKLEVLTGCSDWYTSQMELESLSKITSRHNLYLVDKLKKDVIMLAKILSEEGFKILADELELKLQRNENLDNQDILNLITSIIDFTHGKTTLLEKANENIGELKDDLNDINIGLNDMILNINKDVENKIDSDYIKKIAKNLERVLSGNYKVKENTQ